MRTAVCLLMYGAEAEAERRGRLGAVSEVVGEVEGNLFDSTFTEKR
jgi:hypothetical protein